MNSLDPPLKDGDVAALCGVERTTVLRWKRPEEQHRINVGKMLLLARALECPAVTDLFAPPGYASAIVKLPEPKPKGEPHEKPLRSPPVRDTGRVRQRQPRASRRA